MLDQSNEGMMTLVMEEVLSNTWNKIENEREKRLVKAREKHFLWWSQREIEMSPVMEGQNPPLELSIDQICHLKRKRYRSTQ